MNGEGRPTANEAADSQGVETSSIVRRDVCGMRGHDNPWPCPLHGCPDCATEGGVDDDYVTPAGLTDFLHDLLTELAESFLGGGSCWVCDELQLHHAFSLYPGMACELSDCEHCTSCGRCKNEARYCADCELCVECAEREQPSSCEFYRWDRFLRQEIAFIAHNGLWDRVTKRFGR